MIWDVIYGDISFEGFKFIFLDIVGFCLVMVDVVEKIGIEKSYEVQIEVDLVLFVFDVDKGILFEELVILEGLDF